MTLQLKELQKNRNTLILLGILATISLIIATIVTTKASPSPLKIAAPEKPTAAFSTYDPVTLAIPWEKIKLGTSKSNIENILKKPISSTNENNSLKALYASTTPGQVHTIWYQNDKAIRIDRFVNERLEKITPFAYDQEYGKAEILREQGDPGVYQLRSYRISASERLVLTYDTAYKNVYLMSYMNNEQYSAYLNHLKQSVPDNVHKDIEPWP